MTATYGVDTYGTTYTTPITGDQAGLTHNIVMDNVGLMTAGTPTRSDITSAIPRISIGSEQRQHTDFSERDTFGQKAYHHGFGELNFSDRAKFFKSEGVWTLVPDQVTLAPYWTAHKAANSTSTVDIASADHDFNGVLRSHAEFQGNTYLLVAGDTGADNKLWYWNETNLLWVKSAATSAMSTAGSSTPLDLQSFGIGSNSNMYIAQGESVNMVRFNSDLVTTADNGVPAKFVESFAGKLWRADNLNELYWSADPHSDGSATWTAPTGMNDGTVGDTNALIRGMCVHDRALWVGKDDGIYRVYNSSTSTNEIWTIEKVIDLSHIISEYNGRAMLSFGGNLYFTADRGLGKWDGATIQYMGPDKGANPTENSMQLQSVFNTALPQDINTEPSSLNSGVVGYISSLTTDGTNIYAAVDSGGNGTGGSLSESRVMAWNGSGWHQIYSTNEYNQTAHDSGDYRTQFVSFIPRKANDGWEGYPRILIGNEAVTNTTGSAPDKEDRILQGYLSRWGQNLLDDVAAGYDYAVAFQDTGHLITSWFDGGLPDIEKTFFDLIVNSQNVGLGTTNNNIKVEYQVDDIDVWYEMHQQTDSTHASTDLIINSPTQSLTFPDNGNLDRSIYARKIRLKFTLTRATTGSNFYHTTPVLKSWGYRFVVRPESRFGWNLTVKCYDNLVDLRRRQESRLADELRQHLYTLRDQKIPIIFHDGTELPQIKNKVTNPSMEFLVGLEGSAPSGYTSGGGFTATGVTPAISTTSAYRAHGLRSLKLQPDLATGDAICNIGTFDLLMEDNVFAGANIWVPNGTDRVYLQVIKTSDSSVLAEIAYQEIAASGEFGDIYLANNTRWVRKTLFSENIPAPDNYTLRIIRKSDDAATTEPFYVDTVEFSNNGPNNLKKTNYQYVDGDQLRCRWLGTPHNSESVRQSGYQVYITGMTESLRYPEVRENTTTFESEITLSLREVS
tara:strand:- start:766 stop:3636 length:2871 start_codon:yes stop_codon:yes gene_type:complete